MQKSLIIILTSFFFTLHGQQFQWVNKITGIDNQLFTGNRIMTDKNGSSFVVNTFSSQSIAGSFTVTAGGSQATSIIKYDSIGNVVWVRKITSTNYTNGNCISIDKKSNVYVAGVFVNNAVLGTTTLTTTGSGNDLFVAKYDSAGSLLWVKNFSGTGGARPLSIKNDSLSNSYITGTIFNTVVFGTNTVVASSNQDMLLLKLDSLGNVSWAKKFGGNTQINSYDIDIDRNLNIYTIGHFGSVGGGLGQNLVIGTTTLTSNIKTPDIFFAKFDNSGNPILARKLGGNFSGDRGLGITYDKKNHMYLTGGFEGSAIFGNDTVFANPPIAGKYDCYLAKYDLNGNCKWVTKPDTALSFQGSDVIAPDKNSIYMGTEVVLFKFDSLGNQKWFFKLNNGGSFSLSYDKKGALYLHSPFGGTLTTNTGTLSSGSPTVVNNFVGKIDTTLLTSITLIDNAYLRFIVYPNPTNHSINIQTENTANGANSTIEIINTVGQVVLKTNLKEIIDVQTLSSGIYTIRINYSGLYYKTTKFIKN